MQAASKLSVDRNFSEDGECGLSDTNCEGFPFNMFEGKVTVRLAEPGVRFAFPVLDDVPPSMLDGQLHGKRHLEMEWGEDTGKLSGVACIYLSAYPFLGDGFGIHTLVHRGEIASGKDERVVEGNLRLDRSLRIGTGPVSFNDVGQ